MQPSGKSSSLTDLPLGELLARLADGAPAPAGGSAIAVACGLAAALVEMAATFTLARPELTERHPRMQAAQARAGELRHESLGLAQRELEAYQPVLEAMRLAKGDPTRPARLDAARSLAAEPPLALARVGAELANLGAEMATGANPNLAGDAIAGVLLGEAACRAAACLVTLNLSDHPQDARRRSAGESVRSAWQARLQALPADADTPSTNQ